MSKLNKYGEIDDPSPQSADTALVKCEHCKGSGVCLQGPVSGWDNNYHFSCEGCCQKAGLKRKNRAPCSVCGGVGKVLLKAR